MLLGFAVLGVRYPISHGITSDKGMRFGGKREVIELGILVVDRRGFTDYNI